MRARLRVLLQLVAEDREEDQGEPRTSTGPPTTEPSTGGQQVSQEPPSSTAQRVDEEFLHQLMAAERADVQNQLDVIMEHRPRL